MCLCRVTDADLGPNKMVHVLSLDRCTEVKNAAAL